MDVRGITLHLVLDKDFQRQGWFWEIDQHALTTWSLLAVESQLESFTPWRHLLCRRTNTLGDCSLDSWSMMGNMDKCKACLTTSRLLLQRSPYNHENPGSDNWWPRFLWWLRGRLDTPLPHYPPPTVASVRKLCWGDSAQTPASPQRTIFTSVL